MIIFSIRLTLARLLKKSISKKKFMGFVYEYVKISTGINSLTLIKNLASDLGFSQKAVVLMTMGKPFSCQKLGLVCSNRTRRNFEIRSTDKVFTAKRIFK